MRMPNSVLVWLAWNNLVRNYRRTMFGLCMIGFGVFGLAMAAGFIEDVFEQLGEGTIRGQLGHLQVSRQGYREEGAGRSEAFLISGPKKVQADLGMDPRVVESMSRVYFSGLLTSGTLQFAVEGEGVEPAPEARLSSKMVMLSGRALQINDKMSIVLGEGVARSLEAAVGTPLSLTAASREGALNVVDVEVVGVFRSFSKEFDARAVRVPLIVAQELLQSNAVNTLVLRLGRTADTPYVLRDLADRLRASGLEIHPWYELSDFYASTRRLYDKQFGFLTVIALVLVVMSIVSTINATVYERTAEFGTMRALGSRSGTVFWLILTEAALLGAIGTILGLVVAEIGAAIVTQIGIPMPPPPNMESGYVAGIILTPAQLVHAGLIGVVSAIVAAVPSALRTNRMSVVDALRRAV